MSDKILFENVDIPTNSIEKQKFKSKILNQYRIGKGQGFSLLRDKREIATPRTFLEELADSRFLSTQYIRHHSRPLYTPEPDVVHELVGHAASLTQPAIVSLSRAFGRAAKRASDASIIKLIQAYWYTLEFGAVEENGHIKAYGAGLLSSAGELARFATETELRPWDLDRIADTAFDPTDYQPQIYVVSSFEKMVTELGEWLEKFRS